MFDFDSLRTTVKNASDMISGPNDDTIEFVCDEEDYGVIPEPIPANKVLPDWYRNLKPRMGDGGLNSSTVKRCMPFLDALSMGWIIPLAAEVEMHSNNSGESVNYQWNFDKELISNHSPDQIGGEENPMSPMPVLKFHNYWAMKVPDGYSVLFTAPLNRYEPRFQVFSGVVDCDNYFNYVNFPFVWTQPDYSDVLDAGTPLVQVIPLKRDTMLSDAVTRSMTVEEAKELDKTKASLSSRESLYRNERWQAKRGSRMVKQEGDCGKKSGGCPFHFGKK